MSTRSDRLSNDFRALQKLCAFNEPVKIKMLEDSSPPDYYRIQLSNCKGIESLVVGIPKYRTVHMLEISTFPANYSDPGQLPIVKLLTPIFHPNVYSDGRFCFQGHDISMTTHPLDILVKRVVEMVQYENMRFGSPANTDALDWVNRNLSLFPLSLNSTTTQASSKLNWR